MPQERVPDTIQPVNLESVPFVHSYEPMNTKYALELVNKTFNHYETNRQQNHEDRWLIQESLYLGWLPPKVWDNTSVPRASLAQPITFEQIETALPVIYNAIFEQSDKWFEIEATPGMDPKQAQAIEDYLCYALDDVSDYAGKTARMEFYHAIKDVLLYGNGGILLEWDNDRRAPTLSHIDIRDLYIDEGGVGPSIDDCRSVVLRRLMTVQELVEFRTDDRMNIPSDDILWNMAKTRPITTGDNNQQYRDALRNIHREDTVTDKGVNPSDQRIEVLVYYTKDRIVWLLNRQWVAFIGNNPYGSIPIVVAPCYIVPNRFYALSMADVQEGNQRYIEALMNAHLDELSLALHPPRVQKRGAILTPAQQRWRPGAVITANDAKDVLFQQPAGATANVFGELEYLHNMSEKRTGVTGMMQGKPGPGNVNRTATGVNSQTSGSTSRMQMLVKHIEDFMITPALYKICRMVKVHTGRNTMLPTRASEEGSGYMEAGAFQGNIKITIHASSRMLTKEALMGVVGPLMQFMFNGPLMQSLQQTGRTIDFEEFVRMITEATGIQNRFNLVRPMNEEEQKAAQQPDPAQQAEQQKSQQDAETRLKMGQMKQETEEKKGQIELQKEHIKKQPTPGEQQAQQMTMDIEVQKAGFAKELAQIKLYVEREKNQMDLQMKRLEMQLKQQDHGVSLQQMQEKAGLDQAIGGQKLDLERRRGEQNLELESVRGIIGLRQKQEEGELKIKQAKANPPSKGDKPKKARQRVKRPKTAAKKR